MPRKFAGIHRVAVAVAIALAGAVINVRPATATTTSTTELQDFAEFGVLEVTPRSTTPGGTLHLKGTECRLDGQAAEYVQIYWGRLAYEDGTHQRAASAPVSADGTWSYDFGVPLDAPPEAYVVATGCKGGDQMFHGHQKQVAVTDAAAPTTTTLKQLTSTSTSASPATTVERTTEATSATTGPTTTARALGATGDNASLSWLWALLPAAVAIAAATFLRSRRAR